MRIKALGNITPVALSELGAGRGGRSTTKEGSRLREKEVGECQGRALFVYALIKRRRHAQKVGEFVLCRKP